MLVWLLITPFLGSFIILVLSNIVDSINLIKKIGLITSLISIIISFKIFLLFDFSTNQFQYIGETYKLNSFDIYLGVDGISIYFILLTTIIIPIAILANWNSLLDYIKSYIIIILLLEVLLLTVFLTLDILLFYIFFESTLPPLFILIGIFGSNNRVRASFYLFIYTLLGSLFLLLSILSILSLLGTTDFSNLFKINFNYITQLFLFYGIFIAFAVKTPTIFLNTWLLKAHVESVLGGSIILAAIVLKLSLYGIFRAILPILPKASISCTFIIYVIAVITILYASISTLRTIDIKELIAYSSVSHAAVYILGAFSNSIQGIEGSISLGLAHGFVSSGLFICVGGILYDRSYTRLITFYKGIAQIMPLFAILFFILSLGNCGAPLTFNFVGEFMSLYGAFVRLPLLGLLACSSIILSAAFTMYLFNRVSLGGYYSDNLYNNMFDVTKREFYIVSILGMYTVLLGVYPVGILDSLHYSTSSLLYDIDYICASNDDIDYDFMDNSLQKNEESRPKNRDYPWISASLVDLPQYKSVPSRAVVKIYDLKPNLPHIDKDRRIELDALLSGLIDNERLFKSKDPVAMSSFLNKMQHEYNKDYTVKIGLELYKLSREDPRFGSSLEGKSLSQIGMRSGSIFREALKRSIEKDVND
jgi:NADH-ubiquinone oxidoreductase chain 4